MSRDKTLDLILAEMQELNKEMKEVRQSDIPALQNSITSFDEKIKTIDRQQTWSTRAYTILGGIIAVTVAKFTGHH